MFRFLAHHLRTNSLEQLEGPGGDVLTTQSIRDYLGKEIDEASALNSLADILSTWVTARPDSPIDFQDIYISTDLSSNQLRCALNTLIARKALDKTNGEQYIVLPGLFSLMNSESRSVSFDRKINRYFQEVKIEAKHPFSFIIMPFSEGEFPQRNYYDVIKPLLETQFKINCYRVDEDYLPDRIDNKTYTYLLKSSFVIAELTTLNPNVLYELGIAHMLEKDCIIITRSSINSIPFDINKIRINEYDNDTQLINALKKTIQSLGYSYHA